MLQCLVLACLVLGALGWVNDYDQPANFTCPDKSFLSHIMSQWHHTYYDRVWDFGCRAVPAPISTCQWSGFANDFDGLLYYQCPGEGFITGMYSEHDNHYEDRKFRFYCCDAAENVVSSCYFTDWVNEFDEHMDFVVPSGHVLRGADSFHDNGKEDRRWKFEICTLHP